MMEHSEVRDNSVQHQYWLSQHFYTYSFCSNLVITNFRPSFQRIDSILAWKATFYLIFSDVDKYTILDVRSFW